MASALADENKIYSGGSKKKIIHKLQKKKFLARANFFFFSYRFNHFLENLLYEFNTQSLHRYVHNTYIYL